MRKRLKLKKRSCAMCKVHKMHGAVRWTYKDEARLKQWEQRQRAGFSADDED